MHPHRHLDVGRLRGRERFFLRGRLLRSTARSLTFAAVAAAGATATARASIEPQARSPSANTPPAAAPAPVLTRAPELLEYVPPEYPPELLASGVGGEVVLLLDLDAGGRVERVEVASAAAPELGEAARAAALQLVFSPAEIDGEPAPIRIEYRYTFTPEAPVPDAVSGESAPAAEEPVRFAGTVREAGTRRPIAGAVVAIAGRAVAETDAEGRFEVRGLPPGKIEVRITSRNHDPYTAEEEIAADERLETKYYLVRRSGDPFETVVRTRPERQEVSRVQLERQEVRKIPGTFGDPLRVIENLPGMARVPGGFGGALLVRGTPPEDSAVFIDGVQVPLLYHFGGLTSVVNAEFLERIDFFPGGFGARYGRATAGIVDVQSRELDCDAWRGAAEISAMLASGFLCAPASEWSVAAAGRRSYIDVVLPFVLDNVPREEDEGSFTASPLYWDYQVKANRQAGAHSFAIFAFGSDDRLKIIQTGSAENFNFNLGLHLGFHRVLLRHRLRLGERTTLVSSLTPGYSRQDFFQRASEIDLDSRFGLDIWSVDWREDLRHEVTDWLTLAVGLDHRMGRADLELEVPIQTDLRVYPSPVFDFTDIQRYARELPDYGQGYWVEAAAAPTPDLKIVAGLRLDRHDFHETQGFSLGPRATVRWQPFADSTLKAAYGLYQKLPDQQYLIDGIGNPRLAPERAHHIIAGFEHKLTDLVDVDVQAFYNLRQRLRSPSDEIRYEGGKHPMPGGARLELGTLGPRADDDERRGRAAERERFDEITDRFLRHEPRHGTDDEGGRREAEPGPHRGAVARPKALDIDRVRHVRARLEADEAPRAQVLEVGQ